MEHYLESRIEELEYKLRSGLEDAEFNLRELKESLLQFNCQLRELQHYIITIDERLSKQKL